MAREEEDDFLRKLKKSLRNPLFYKGQRFQRPILQ